MRLAISINYKHLEFTSKTFWFYLKKKSRPRPRPVSSERFLGLVDKKKASTRSRPTMQARPTAAATRAREAPRGGHWPAISCYLLLTATRLGYGPRFNYCASRSSRVLRVGISFCFGCRRRAFFRMPSERWLLGRRVAHRHLSAVKMQPETLPICFRSTWCLLVFFFRLRLGDFRVPLLSRFVTLVSLSDDAFRLRFCVLLSVSEYEEKSAVYVSTLSFVLMAVFL